jgi:hypothetical protein
MEYFMGKILYCSLAVFAFEFADAAFLKTVSGINNDPGEITATDSQESSENSAHKAIQKSDKDELSGFFLGIGFTACSSKAKVTHLDTKCDAPLPAELGGDNDMERAFRVVSELLPEHGISEIYCGNGRMTATAQFMSNIVNSKNSKPGGTLLIGYGDFIYHDLYAGVEACIDLTTKADAAGIHDAALLDYEDFHLKQKGLVSVVSARLGVYFDFLKAMAYTKVGAAYINDEVHNRFLGNMKLSKFTPAIGLGIEKSFGKVQMRIEGEYRFLSKSKKQIHANTVFEIQPIDGVGAVNVPASLNSGISLEASRGVVGRVLFVFHI